MKSNRRQVTRRRFLSCTTAAAAGAATILPRRTVAGSARTPPSEKLRLAFVGRGGHNLKSLAKLQQHVVGLCNVDQERAAPALAQFPSAKHCHDYRQMLDKLDDPIDAVVVSTPNGLRQSTKPDWFLVHIRWSALFERSCSAEIPLVQKQQKPRFYRT